MMDHFAHGVALVGHGLGQMAFFILLMESEVCLAESIRSMVPGLDRNQSRSGDLCRALCRVSNLV